LAKINKIKNLAEEKQNKYRSQQKLLIWMFDAI
jgi:hypothetical protein